MNRDEILQEIRRCEREIKAMDYRIKIAKDIREELEDRKIFMESKLEVEK